MIDSMAGLPDGVFDALPCCAGGGGGETSMASRAGAGEASGDRDGRILPAGDMKLPRSAGIALGVTDRFAMGRT